LKVKTKYKHESVTHFIQKKVRLFYQIRTYFQNL